MTTTYEPPQPNAALVVGPDDVLVLGYRSLAESDIDRLKDSLRERFPGLVDRVLFANATDMAVIPTPAPPSGAEALSTTGPG